MNAAIYARISKDSEGEGLGVTRQLDDCRKLVAARGWPVAGEYVDNDISASNGRHRPQYERLLEDVKAGTVTAIVAWHPDRLHRSPRELEDFIDLLERHHAEVATVTSGKYDLTTPDGRQNARIVGAVAKGEVEKMSGRIRRKHKQLAEAGKRSGGGTRAFGYEADGRSVRPAEATAVRELAERVLAGESLRSLCLDLDRRGITTPTGKPWAQSVLRRTLLRADLAGLRTLHGDPTTATPGDWPAIITADTYAALVRYLTDPGRRTTRAGRGRYLLTGLLRCGHCGQRMMGHPRGTGLTYHCQPPPHPGCGRTRIKAEPLEELVTEMALAALDGPALAAAMAAKERDLSAEEAQLKADRARRDELAAMFATGDMTRAEWEVARKVLLSRIEATEKALARANGKTALLGVQGRARELWPSLGFDRRNAILKALFHHITIGPGVRGRNRFDPDRVQPEWRA